MNVFVLCTGRCGSTTFTRACKHISNYSASHESRKNEILEDRISYPKNHIEVDNRLSWFLGRLDSKYGNDPFYVHLKRGKISTAKSFEKRYNMGIIRAYKKGIIPGGEHHDGIDVCRDYYRTVNSNIRMFLKDKTKKMTFKLENSRGDFEKFWNKINAQGDFDSAIGEWENNHNRSEFLEEDLRENAKKPFRFVSKLGRAVMGLPEYFKNV